MSGYVLAIDGGSQSTKVSIVDERGTIHAYSKVPLRPYLSPSPGKWEHPDDDLWFALVAAIRHSLSEFSGDISSIRGIGLCSIRFCRAVLEEDGTLAQPVMSWMDRRVSEPFDVESAAARYVTTSAGYLAHRLTGEFRDSVGNYQGMWPIDSHRWSWSNQPSEFVRMGMPREMLFDLVQPGEQLGVITEQAAKATGLPLGLPIIATSNDKAVEALGAGLRNESTFALSLGTYVSGMMLGTRPADTSPNYWTNFGARPGQYLYESAGIRRGMWTVSWFRDIVGSCSELDLDRGAEKVQPGSEGLFVSLDWLAPEEEPYRKGAIVGFDGTQGRYHIHRAILEALVMTMANHAERLSGAIDRKIDSVLVTGGGSASDLILEMVAAVFDVPANRPAVADAAMLGAAVSAAVAVGLHPTWEEALDAMVATSPSIRPEDGLVRQYQTIRQDFNEIVLRAQKLLA